MGSKPNLSIKWSITIGTMINTDSGFDGHGHRDSMCKRAFIQRGVYNGHGHS